MKWVTRHALILGLCFILLANMGLWAATYWNRQGTPESTLVLSERELNIIRQSYAPLHPVNKEGEVKQAVRLTLRVNNHSNRLGNMYMIPQEKMEALGFSHEFIEKTGKPKPFFLWRLQKKLAFVVLEMEGPFHQQFMLETKAALAGSPCNETDKTCESLSSLSPEALKQLQATSSRLYIVDVGLDQQTLRTRYPDRDHYAIVHGTVQASPGTFSDSSPPQLMGWVQDILVPEISLPLEWHDDALYERPAHFEAEVSFGQRLEPWLTGFKTENPEKTN